MAGAHDPLRVGFVGSGFIARFHLQGFQGVRGAQITGVYSPTAPHRAAFARQVNDLELGPCRAYDSLAAMLDSGTIDAVWILGTNDTRLPTMRAVCQAITERKIDLKGVACEKPLARTLAEGREMLRLVQSAGLNHGYLENMLFSTGVQRGKDIVWRRGVPGAGRPYLARATEEHSGPHAPWFWRGDKQGGGVLTDMMCHSVEVGRFLLTPPDKDRQSLTLRSASGMVTSLKWTRPKYAQELRQAMGADVDYAEHPSEDFARGLLTLEDDEGNRALIETTTSWAYVGPGLRTQVELLGPEYSMELNTLNTGLKVFFSRRVAGSSGEYLVEKQNAEQGLMPVVEDEAAIYGYALEDRHMVDCFRKGVAPMETFTDGVAVVEMLMALYRSAELGQAVTLPCPELETYVPPVARGEWQP